MFKEFSKMVKDSLQDNATGKYSHARILSMLVAIAATIFIWKLIILGGMSLEYFVAYLAYGAGHQSLNKFLDNRDGSRMMDAENRQFQARRISASAAIDENSTSVSAVVKTTQIRVRGEVYTDDDIPRPPRNY